MQDHNHGDVRMIMINDHGDVNCREGKPVYTKTDEFPENFRTASDPPAPFSEKILQFFPQTGCTSTKFAMKFFRSEAFSGNS